MPLARILGPGQWLVFEIVLTEFSSGAI